MCENDMDDIFMNYAIFITWGVAISYQYERF